LRAPDLASKVFTEATGGAPSGGDALRDFAEADIEIRHREIEWLKTKPRAMINW
jgi:hypothetical protein